MIDPELTKLPFTVVRPGELPGDNVAPDWTFRSPLKVPTLNVPPVKLKLLVPEPFVMVEALSNPPESAYVPLEPD